MNLVFATRNAHKLEEVKAILGPAVNLLDLNDVGFVDELPETGNTLRENAVEKLMYFVNKTGLAAFADDSGLEINCLDGKPGVDTAHYSGSRDAIANIRKVLAELEGCSNRSARFVTVIACYINNELRLFEGEVKGEIATHVSGTEGFGYDPIFIPEGYTQTFAELPAALKNSISHRARALESFSEWLSRTE